jgi:hypothetical protein
MSDLQTFKRLQPYYEYIIHILKYKSPKTDYRILTRFLDNIKTDISKRDHDKLSKWAALQINNPDYY